VHRSAADCERTTPPAHSKQRKPKNERRAPLATLTALGVSIVTALGIMAINSVGALQSGTLCPVYERLTPDAYNTHCSGIPRIDPDYSQDVETWWRNHPFNPEGGNYRPVIASPFHIVDVYPGTSIQAAIDSLPQSGGTVRLSPGSYDGFDIIGRSNVHVIAEGGAIIRSTSLAHDWDRKMNVAVRLYGCSQAGELTDPAKYSNYYGQFNALIHSKDPSSWACFVNRTRNIYLKGLTLDGENRPDALVGIIMGAVRDVVMDDITFKNYTMLTYGHPGLVQGHEGIDNIWCRDCHFEGSQRAAVYMDGCVACGVMNSDFKGSYFGSNILSFLTNDDFAYDIDGNGQYDLSEIRNTQYNVFYNNIVIGETTNFFSFHGQDNLVKGNKTEGVIYSFGEISAFPTQRSAGLIYKHYNNVIVGNTSGFTNRFLDISGHEGTLHNNNPAEWGRVGKVVIVNNNIASVPDGFLFVRETPPVDGPHIICGNRIGGQLIPQNDADECPNPTPATEHR